MELHLLACTAEASTAWPLNKCQTLQCHKWIFLEDNHGNAVKGRLKILLHIPQQRYGCDSLFTGRRIFFQTFCHGSYGLCHKALLDFHCLCVWYFCKPDVWLLVCLSVLIPRTELAFICFPTSECFSPALHPCVQAAKVNLTQSQRGQYLV